jgi:hypothetical protein
MMLLVAYSSTVVSIRKAGSGIAPSNARET